MSEFVRVYGMGDEEGRDVLVRPAMSMERVGALGVPMTLSRLQHGYTMRRDRLADLRAVCQHQQIGFKYDPKPPKWNEDECRAGWGRIKRSMEAAMDDLTQFCLSEGWKALGYKTFEELCDADLYGVRFPAIEQRRAAVKQMTDAGVPTRTISTALGQDRTTTWRDQRAMRPHVSTSRDVANATSGEVIEGQVIERDVPQWTAPRRDPAHVMAYQEGMTSTPPPPDLACVEATLCLLRTGEDSIPHDPLLSLYRASRNACSRLGLLDQEEK